MTPRVETKKQQTANKVEQLWRLCGWFDMLYCTLNLPQPQQNSTRLWGMFLWSATLQAGHTILHNECEIHWSKLIRSSDHIQTWSCEFWWHVSDLGFFIDHVNNGGIIFEYDKHGQVSAVGDVTGTSTSMVPRGSIRWCKVWATCLRVCQVIQNAVRNCSAGYIKAQSSLKRNDLRLGTAVWHCFLILANPSQRHGRIWPEDAQRSIKRGLGLLRVSCTWSVLQ